MQSWAILALVAAGGVATVFLGVLQLNRRSEMLERAFRNPVISDRNRFYAEVPKTNFGPAILVILLGMVIAFIGLIGLVVVLQNQ
jgi:hypothetical protein